MFVPAFNGLYAPYWRTDARGVLVGLSGNVGRGQIARATLEAVAHQSRQLLETMDAEAQAHGQGSSAPRGGAPPPSLKVDGGMTGNSLLMQFQADVTGRRVVRPRVAETTALGAAYAAGLAQGFWKDMAELAAQWQESASWTPRMPADAVALSCVNWERAVARSLNWSSPDACAVALRADPALALLAAPQPAHGKGGPRQGALLPPGLLRTRAGRLAVGVGLLGLAWGALA